MQHASGSCLGPLLLKLYTNKLLQIIQYHMPIMHCYADDFQVWAVLELNGHPLIENEQKLPKTSSVFLPIVLLKSKVTPINNWKAMGQNVPSRWFFGHF